MGVRGDGISMGVEVLCLQQHRKGPPGGSGRGHETWNELAYCTVIWLRVQPDFHHRNFHVPKAGSSELGDNSDHLPESLFLPQKL